MVATYNFGSVYLIIVAVSKEKCSKLPLSFLLLYNYLYSCCILIQQRKVTHVMPRLTCYMHACVHVVLIILI